MVRPYVRDFVNTLSGRRRERIADLLEEARVGKRQIQTIADRLQDSQESDLSPVVLDRDLPGMIRSGTQITNANDINANISDIFAVTNLSSLLLESHKSILGSEVKAIEDELVSLEEVMLNFAFLLADNQAYNYAYLETFGDELNRDNLNPVPDRSGVDFSMAEQAIIRPDESILTIENVPDTGHALTVEILEGNTTAMVVSDTGLENMLRRGSSSGWRMVTQTGEPVKTGLSGSDGVTGAQVWLEFRLSQPVPCTELKLVPFSNIPVDLLRVVLYENDSENGVDLLSEKRSLEHSVTLHFPLQVVSRFRVLINQDTYERITHTEDIFEKEYKEVLVRIRHRYYRYPYRHIGGLYYPLLFDSRYISGLYHYPIVNQSLNEGEMSEEFLEEVRKVYSSFSVYSNLAGLLFYYHGHPPSGLDPNEYRSNPHLYRSYLANPYYWEHPYYWGNYPYYWGVPGGIRHPLAPYWVHPYRKWWYRGVVDTFVPISVPTGREVFKETVIIGHSYQYELGLNYVKIGSTEAGFRAAFVSKPMASPGDIGEVRIKTSEKNYMDSPRNHEDSSEDVAQDYRHIWNYGGNGSPWSPAVWEERNQEQATLDISESRGRMITDGIEDSYIGSARAYMETPGIQNCGARVRIEIPAVQEMSFNLILRGSGEWQAREEGAYPTYGYVFTIESTGLGHVRRMGSDLTDVELGRLSVAFSPGDIIWLEARCDSDRIKMRAWREGDNQPLWQIDRTDDQLIEPGRVGVSLRPGSSANKKTILLREIVVWDIDLQIPDAVEDIGLESGVLTSVEYSVSNEHSPTKEDSWIPILPVGHETVVGERLFPNHLRECHFRFPALMSSVVTVYRNNRRISVNDDHLILEGGIYLIGIKIPESQFSGTDIYTCDYTPVNGQTVVNFAERGFSSIPLVAAYDSDGAGERFASTGERNIVQLLHTPFVDLERLESPTYEPVVVRTDRGVVPINLTDYTTGEKPALPEEDFYYIHSDRTLMFNRPLEDSFRVYYQYLQNNVRTRVILRCNTDNFVGPEVDFYHLKAKTRQ